VVHCHGKAELKFYIPTYGEQFVILDLLTIVLMYCVDHWAMGHAIPLQQGQAMVVALVRYG